MEAAVDIDCHHDEQVGQHDEDTDGDSKSHHQFADCVPFCGKILSTPVIKKGDGFIVEALQFIHGCELKRKRRKMKKKKKKEKRNRTSKFKDIQITQDFSGKCGKDKKKAKNLKI